jgi:hypothetical protein
MMNQLCLMFLLVLWPGQTQRKSFDEIKAEAERQNPPAQTAAPQMGYKDRDPFFQDWAEFQQHNNSWQQLDDQLEESLRGVSACDPEATSIVAKVKDAAFRTIDAQRNYFKKWTTLASQNIQAFRQAMQSRSGLRREIELSLAGLDREHAELLERRRTLDRELRTTKTESDSREVKALDRLIASGEERAANFRQALSNWDEAGRNGATTIDAAEALRANVVGYQRLLESSTALWHAYYSAAESRLGLKCWRDELQPQTPVIRNPQSRSGQPGVEK